MSDEETQRLVLRGLVIVLILLTLALIAESALLAAAIISGYHISEEASSVGTISVMALAIIGVISVYVKASSRQD